VILKINLGSVKVKTKLAARSCLKPWFKSHLDWSNRAVSNSKYLTKGVWIISRSKYSIPLTHRRQKEYQSIFGISFDKLTGKILDIGSGIKDIFPSDSEITKYIRSSLHSPEGKRESSFKNRLVNLDGLKLPFRDESFDHIFALASLSLFVLINESLSDTVANITTMLKEIARILKFEGYAHIFPVHHDDIEPYEEVLNKINSTSDKSHFKLKSEWTLVTNQERDPLNNLYRLTIQKISIW